MGNAEEEDALNLNNNNMIFRSDRFRKDIITKRCIVNNMTMDEACKEIGISKATLSRVEREKLPDVETFGKICIWLKTDANKYLQINSNRSES